MSSLLKSDKALDILTTISLAQFLIIIAIVIGICVFIYKFKDNLKEIFEDYRKKENSKEDFVNMVKRHDEEIKNLKKHHEEDMKENYNKQLKYREQSLEKQAAINNQFIDVSTQFIDVNQKIDDLMELIKEHYEETKRLRRNELRDKLINSYRYYTSIEQNPLQQWNEMESEAFWHLFSDYEENGGNGFMHETVKPAMEKLTIIKMSDL